MAKPRTKLITPPVGEQRRYDPNVSSIPFHESTVRTKALCGPVGSGKSTVAIMEFFMLCHESKVSIRGLVLRETYRQLADSTRRTWDDWLGPCSRYVRSDERMELTIPGADGKIRTHYLDFRHARRSEDATAFLSTEYAFIWLEEPVPAFEISRVNGTGVIGGGIPKEVYDIADTRLRQRGVHRRHIILTFNPPNKYHWVYKRFFEKGPKYLEEMDSALFRQPARENSLNLPANYYDSLSRTLDPVLVRRFVEGEPVTLYPGVRVYPDCHDSVHIVTGLQPTPGLGIITAHDWGLTPVALFGQLLPSGQLVILREIQLWNAGASKLAEQMEVVMKAALSTGGFRGYRIHRSWGDPAGSTPAESDENTCFAVMAAAGFPVQPGAVTFQERREATTNLLNRMAEGKPAIVIDQHGCPILAEGMMGGYRYPETSDGRIKYAPLKNDFSHSCNALEYLITGEFNFLSNSPREHEEKAEKIVQERWNPLSRLKGRGSSTWMSK